MTAKTAGPVHGSPAGFAADDVVVSDDFLSPSQISALRQCAEVRRARGDFSAARVGADRRRQQREEIRGDSTCWLEEPLLAEETALLDEFEQLRLALNREGFLGLFDLELHYACYPPGSGYARHVDQLQGRDQRTVSVILYLNEGWLPGAGGELRLFDGAEYYDLEPIGGRLVYFLTAGREHAVLPTKHERLSISGWFRRR